MDREILFRGKLLVFDNWVEGDLLNYSPNPKICVTRNEEEDKDLYFVLKETVGQYTGLTDKNGRKIFEGDIVRFDDGQTKFKGKVTNECGAWGIATQDMIPLELKYSCKNDNFMSFWELMWNSDDLDCLIDEYVPYVEVIGNIHDNPELLEVSE